MAGQDIGQPEAIRRSGHLYNGLVLQNERSIKTAKSLAVALAAHLEKPRPLRSKYWPDHLPRSPLDPASSGKFVKNVIPYMLALSHFLECYRNKLADDIPDSDPVNRRFADPILSQTYNKESIYRISALYHILYQVLGRHLYRRNDKCRPITMAALLKIGRCSYTGSTNKYAPDITDVFAFGGLDAVNDVIAQPTMKLSLSVLEEHFTRACPELGARAHIMNTSTLAQVDRARAERICRRLPRRNEPILFIRPFTIASFYKHLTTYEGDEPKLFL